MENESAVLDQEQIEESSPSQVEASLTSTEIETKMEEPGPAAGDPPATEEEPAKETEQPATEGEEEKPADGEGPAAAVHGSPIK
jgi:hypothetical protein